MEQNKTNRANLENKKGIFLEIGAILTLALLLMAFEWTTAVNPADGLGDLDAIWVDESDLPPITRAEPELLPPPPPERRVAEIIDIVTDNIPDDFAAFDAEADQNTKVEIVDMVEPVSVEEPVEAIPDIMDAFSTEEPAEFPGGEQTLRKYIAKNLRYPQLAAENDIQGSVFIQFVVDADGSVTDAAVLKGVDKLLDNEAIRVISQLPKFKPAKHRGKPVKMRMQVPVKFVLQR